MEFWKENYGASLKKEKRKPIPMLMKTKITLTILTWVSLFLSYMIIDSTNPPNFMVPLIDNMYGKEFVYTPEPIYSTIALLLCILSLIFSITKTYLMFKYKKRKKDKISPLTIASIIISLVAGIYIAVYFI